MQAVETILNNTEEANRDAQSALNAARAAVRNTNSILSGDARTIMSGEDYPPFPTGNLTIHFFLFTGGSWFLSLLLFDLEIV